MKKKQAVARQTKTQKRAIKVKEDKATIVARRKKSVTRWTLDLFIITVASLIYSLGLHCFTVPSNIAPGGVAGISTIIHYLTTLDIGFLYLVINVPLVIIGFIFLGKRMMIKTLFSVVVISIATDFVLLKMPVYKGDTFLAAIFGGVLFGIGLGLVYTREATTGGTDIINKIINKKFPHYSIGKIMLATDALIIAASVFVFGNIESGLYAIVSMFVCTKILDVILYGSFESKMLLVFSEKYEDISKHIMSSYDRGVTFLNASGGYTGKETKIICCAVHKNEYVKIKRNIKEIDPRAFIIICNAGEVLGEGFSENQ